MRISTTPRTASFGKKSTGMRVRRENKRDNARTASLTAAQKAVVHGVPISPGPPLVLACEAPGREDAHGTARGIQRRRDRDYHHDHGAGNEAASWGPPGRSAVRAARIPQLRPEFHLC